MQTCRHGRPVLRQVFAAVRGVDPDVDLVHRANFAALNQINYPMIILARVNLRADLRDQLVLACESSNDATLRDGARQWLLAINVAPASKRRSCGYRINVIKSH